MTDVVKHGRCAECMYFSVLAHNFTIGEGFKKDNCCVLFPLTERKGYVVQVKENDVCEESQRSKNNS